MMTDANTNQQILLKTVLENSGLALATMAAMADALDDLVGDLVLGDDVSKSSQIDANSLQRVDLLRQSIHAMAALMGNLADLQTSDQYVSLDQAGDRVNLQWIQETCLPRCSSNENRKAAS
jgi:hypothetical protein